MIFPPKAEGMLVHRFFASARLAGNDPRPARLAGQPDDRRAGVFLRDNKVSRSCQERAPGADEVAQVTRGLRPLRLVPGTRR